MTSRLLDGDSAAAEEFLARFGRLIRHVLRTQGLSGQEQEDLFQQVILHFWEQDRRRLRGWNVGRHGKLSAYIGVTVAHLVCDYREQQARLLQVATQSARRTAHVPDDQVTDACADPWLGVLGQMQRNALRTALRAMPERDAVLIDLRYYQGRSYREMASTLGLTVGHIGVALSRAEARLRRRLLDQHDSLFSEHASGAR